MGMLPRRRRGASSPLSIPRAEARPEGLEGLAASLDHVVGSAVRRGRRLVVDLVVARPEALHEGGDGLPTPSDAAPEQAEERVPLEVVVRLAGAAPLPPSEHPVAAGWTAAERVECEGEADAQVLVFRFTSQGPVPPTASRPLLFEAEVPDAAVLTLQVDVPAPQARPLVLAVG